MTSQKHQKEMDNNLQSRMDDNSKRVMMKINLREEGVFSVRYKDTRTRQGEYFKEILKCRKRKRMHVKGANGGQGS